MNSTELYHPIELPGDLRIPGNLFLAPLAGITDKGFRRICLDHQAPFTFTEMVSGEALARNNEKTFRLLDRCEHEHLLGVQIFLSDADQAVRALPRILEAEPDLIDINCGCPVPKVVKTGAGSALMKEPKKIGEIVFAIRSRCSVPVSVKLRTGWDSHSLTYLDAARRAEDAGACMVSLHGRTRSQGYSGHADWSTIATLKKAISLPLIGNGDAFTPESAKAMLVETSCDGVMFARGAMGNPFIFSRTIEYLRTGILPPPPSTEEIMQTALRHLSYTVAYKGEQAACKEMRKQMSEYSKGLAGSAQLRSLLVHCESQDAFQTVIENYLQQRQA